MVLDRGLTLEANSEDESPLATKGTTAKISQGRINI